LLLFTRAVEASSGHLSRNDRDTWVHLAFLYVHISNVILINTIKEREREREREREGGGRRRVEGVHTILAEFFIIAKGSGKAASTRESRIPRIRIFQRSSSSNSATAAAFRERSSLRHVRAAGARVHTSSRRIVAARMALPARPAYRHAFGMARLSERAGCYTSGNQDLFACGRPN